MTRLTILIFFLCSIISTAAAQDNSIDWRKDFKQSIAESRQTGKPVLIYFYTPGCDQCKQMDEQYWATEKVAIALKNFVAVKLNLDNEKPLAAKFNVAGAPFVAFTDPLGNLISSRRGFDKDAPRRLNTSIKDTTKDFSNLEKAYEAIEKKKDDGGALLEIADSYRTSGNLFLSNEFYKKALKTPEVTNDAEKKERALFALGVNAVGFRDYKEAAGYLESYSKSYPHGTYRETALTLLVVADANQDKFDESDKYLSQLKAEFPDSKNVAVAAKAVENARNKRSR